MVSANALAAPPSLVGAWSVSVPGQGGMTLINEAFQADGTYVSVRREPNGTMLRVWGSYRSTAVSPSQLRVESTVQGWLPRQICAQAPGFPVRCSAFTPPAPQPMTLAFSSPESFQVDGFTVHREASPGLLQQAVSERLVMAAQAPVQPIIRPPVMPGVPGGPAHVTPIDPTAGPARDDLQQRRICSINGGNLVVVSGRLTCLN
jgi:hypothetical protein